MYLGVDYYPEHWDDSMIDEDLKRMKDMGVNIIRIGEFAWHLMEPTEGDYNFTFFDKVIEKVKTYDIKIIFGTPTATFPAWLAKRYPSILSKDEYGHTKVFGGRRQYCYNSNIYRQYTEKIVSRIVKHYKNEDSIIAWQVDNELGHEGSDMCYCEECHTKFQIYLKDKYKDIEALNNIYGTIFWGQTYNSFDEIPLPQPTVTTHNPALQLDWARFRSYSINSYGKLQIDIIRRYKGKHQEITHNFYGGFFERAYNQNILAEELDFVSYDNYPVWGGLKEPLKPACIAMGHDYIRGLKNQNYWIVEELMGSQGHNIIGYLPRPNQAKMWAYQAMAHGCEGLLFFRWRSMNRGAEQYCQGIIDYDNEVGRKYNEAKAFMKEIVKYKKLLKTKINSEIAVLYDFDNIWSWHFQPQSREFNFTEELVRLYTPFYNLNTNIDVISTSKDFSSYKVLVVPVMQIIDDRLSNAFEDFVKKGGIILFSFRTGIKDRNNNVYFKEVIPCKIRRIAGITIKEAEALHEGQEIEIIKSQDNVIGKCRVWRDIITPEDAEVLYYYNDTFYRKKACITVNRYGKGKVYYIGGGVNEDILNVIAKTIVKEKDIKYIDSPNGLEVYTRDYKDKKWYIICNHTHEEIEFWGEIIHPYEAKIVQDIK